jgi:hypothetical protein
VGPSEAHHSWPAGLGEVQACQVRWPPSSQSPVCRRPQAPGPPGLPAWPRNRRCCSELSPVTSYASLTIIMACIRAFLPAPSKVRKMVNSEWPHPDPRTPVNDECQTTIHCSMFLHRVSYILSSTRTDPRYSSLVSPSLQPRAHDFGLDQPASLQPLLLSRGGLSIRSWSATRPASAQLQLAGHR